MKPEDSFTEIDRLLRSRQPDRIASAGLETRILNALDEHRATRPERRWSAWWLTLPAAAAVLIFVVLRPTPPEATIVPVVADTVVSEEIQEIISRDPLREESLALVRDVQRAGDFLKEIMPGF